MPETAHAVTIRAGNGAEILLHVGVDTVALKGEGFEALVRTGDRVSVGDACRGRPLVALSSTHVPAASSFSSIVL